MSNDRASQLNAFQGGFAALLKKNPLIKAAAVIQEDDNETGLTYELCGSSDMTNFIDFCVKQTINKNPIAKSVRDAFKLNADTNPNFFDTMRRWIISEQERVVKEVPVEDAEDWRAIFIQLLKALKDMEDGLWDNPPAVIILSLYAYSHAALESTERK